MADVSGYGTGMIDTLAHVLPSTGSSGSPSNLRLTPGVTYFYQMEGIDAVTTSTDSWVVQGAPDFTAQFYTGGLTQPLRFVRIVAQWPAPQT